MVNIPLCPLWCIGTFAPSFVSPCSLGHIRFVLISIPRVVSWKLPFLLLTNCLSVQYARGCPWLIPPKHHSVLLKTYEPYIASLIIFVFSHCSSYPSARVFYFPLSVITASHNHAECMCLANANKIKFLVFGWHLIDKLTSAKRYTKDVFTVSEFAIKMQRP